MKGKSAVTIYFFLVAGWIFCSSCATIFSKRSYPVVVESNPTEAALRVTNKDNREIFKGSTPTVLHLNCNCGVFKTDSFNLLFERPDGPSRSMKLKCKLSPLYIGNFIFGIWGYLLDPVMGGIYRMDTKYVKADFDSVRPSLTASTRLPMEYKAKQAAAEAYEASLTADTIAPGRFIISTNVLQYATGDISLNAECAIAKNVSVGASGGWIFPVRKVVLPREWEANDDQTPFWVYKGYVVRLYAKIYSTKMPGHYFSPLLLFKDLRYDHQHFVDRHTGSGEELEEYERSEKAQVFSVQFLFGKEKVTKHFLMDSYVGLGARMRSRDFYTYNCTYDGYSQCYDHHPGPGSYVQYFPDFHLGFRMGFRK